MHIAVFLQGGYVLNNGVKMGKWGQKWGLPLTLIDIVLYFSYRFFVNSAAFLNRKLFFYLNESRADLFLGDCAFKKMSNQVGG